MVLHFSVLIKALVILGDLLRGHFVLRYQILVKILGVTRQIFGHLVNLLSTLHLKLIQLDNSLLLLDEITAYRYVLDHRD